MLQYFYIQFIFCLKECSYMRNKSIESKVFHINSHHTGFLLLPAYAERLVPYSKKNCYNRLSRSGRNFSLVIAYEYSVKKAGTPTILELFVNPQPDCISKDMVKIISKAGVVLYGRLSIITQ